MFPGGSCQRLRSKYENTATFSQLQYPKQPVWQTHLPRSWVYMSWNKSSQSQVRDLYFHLSVPIRRSLIVHNGSHSELQPTSAMTTKHLKKKNKKRKQLVRLWIFRAYSVQSNNFLHRAHNARQAASAARAFAFIRFDNNSCTLACSPSAVRLLSLAAMKCCSCLCVGVHLATYKQTPFYSEMRWAHFSRLSTALIFVGTWCRACSFHTRVSVFIRFACVHA